MTNTTTASPEMGTEGLDLNEATTAIEALLTSSEEEETPTTEENQAEVPLEEAEETEEAEDGQEEAETEDKQEEDQEPVYEVTLPGGEKAEVPVTELLEGYTRTADYTKKTQALAEQRKEFEALSAQREAELRNQYVDKLDALEKLLSAEVEVDWDNLERSNPQEYLRLKMHDLERKEAIKLAREEKERVQQENAAKERANYNHYLAEQFKALAEKDQIFGDKNKGAEVWKEVNTYLADMGYSPQEIQQLADHRAILIVRDALKYRSMQNKAKTVAEKKVVNVPKVQKPGAVRETNPKQDQAKALQARVKKTGSVRDAAAFFESLL